METTFLNYLYNVLNALAYQTEWTGKDEYKSFLEDECGIDYEFLTEQFMEKCGVEMPTPEESEED